MHEPGRELTCPDPAAPRRRDVTREGGLWEHRGPVRSQRGFTASEADGISGSGRERRPSRADIRRMLDGRTVSRRQRSLRNGPADRLHRHGHPTSRSHPGNTRAKAELPRRQRCWRCLMSCAPATVRRSAGTCGRAAPSRWWATARSACAPFSLAGGSAPAGSTDPPRRRDNRRPVAGHRVSDTTTGDAQEPDFGTVGHRCESTFRAEDDRVVVVPDGCSIGSGKYHAGPG